jgi:hypothetical protein
MPKDTTYYIEMNPEHPTVQDIRLNRSLTKTQAFVATRELSEQFRDYTLHLYRGIQYLISFCRGSMREVPPGERNT